MDWEKSYQHLYQWLLTHGPRILAAILVLVVGLWLSRLLKKWLQKVMRRKQFDRSLQPFLISLSITVFNILIILAFLQVAGIQLTLFAALIGAFGVAAGLALSGTLQNFTSGILILLLKPFRAGDNIIAQGTEGTVTSIQIFYTVVTAFDNRTVIIPNSKLSNEIIINTSREPGRRMDIELKFSYGIDFNAVDGIIKKSVDATVSILKEPAPRISISSLEPDGYKVMINVWTKAHGYTDSKYAFQLQLLEQLKAGGIKLPGM